MRNCTTHSHACDCREEYFKKLEAENAELRKDSVRHLAKFAEDVVTLREAFQSKIDVAVKYIERNAKAGCSVAREALAQIQGEK